MERNALTNFFYVSVCDRIITYISHVKVRDASRFRAKFTSGPLSLKMFYEINHVLGILTIGLYYTLDILRNADVQKRLYSPEKETKESNQDRPVLTDVSIRVKIFVATMRKKVNGSGHRVYKITSLPSNTFNSNNTALDITSI